MSNLEHLLDEELYALMLKDKRAAFHVIYERYKAAMLIYAAKRVPLEIAEDLVHDVFIRIWNNRNEIEIGEKFAGYLFKSLRHIIIDHMAKDANAQNYLDALSTFAQSYSFERADDKLRESLFLEGIQVLLQHFNPQYLEIFRLRVEGYSNHEIAEKLGLSEKTVRNQYSLILKYLKDKLPFLLILLLTAR
ncbi:MAG: sigma-70 family RNA polymerase sigma factor [Sphingobacterium sp.]|jgi:RNA polymerase sigma-70 factor (ECF subfamily)|nr:sigma-70 family RNA polymerase sigma factor [Sphingobacterium sp.]